MTAAATAPTTRSTTRRRDAVLGLSGLAFFVPLVLVIAVPHASLDYPTTRPPAGSVITAFYRTHATLEQYQTVMHSVAALALLVFVGALAAHVRRRSVPAAALMLAGGTGAALVMLMTMALVSSVLGQTGAVGGRELGWLYQVGWTTHFAAVFFLPIALVPACDVLARTRALPTVVARAGQLVGVLGAVALVGTVGLPFLRFPVFFLLMLWVLVVAVVALTRGIDEEPSARRAHG